jgi:hypothetical protein
MMTLRVIVVPLALFGLTACPTTPPRTDSGEPPTRGIPGTEIQDSVYLPVERAKPPPPGYGLYTVLLARSADAKTLQVMSELFTSTGGANDSAMKRENLNLIMIPVKNAAEAARVLETARNAPEAVAAEVMQKLYDFSQAAMLISSACRADRGPAVMKACGSTSPDGPLLVTTQLPLDGSMSPGQKFLIVNLSATPTGALREVFAAYRQQIRRSDFADGVEIDSWRLVALNLVLDTAELLPKLRKAYVSSIAE